MRKTVMVTGGTRGIGSRIVEAFAAAGYDVAVHGRSVNEEQQRHLSALSEKYGSKITPVLGDLKNADGISVLFEKMKQEFGRIDVLINNAGFETFAALEEFSAQEWNDIIQVNMTAPFQCAQLAAKMMKEQKSGGVIINVSSIHDTMPRKGNGAYCVAKAGLNMFTKCAALEWAEYGIRVITVSPGAIETDMNRDAIDAFGRDRFNRWIPAGRIGTCDEVASLISYLCDYIAAYITGTDIYIDGGYLLNTVRYDDRPGREEIY